jgi:rhodanese-related sulfurtransferase
MKLLSRWFGREPTKPSWIDPVALAARIEGDAALLVLDVRGPDEFTGPLGHIEQAKNLPLSELPTHLSDLVRESRPVVVVCKTDRRSSMAAQQLQQAGMVDVSVLRGGMERWRALGLPAS